MKLQIKNHKFVCSGFIKNSHFYIEITAEKNKIKQFARVSADYKKKKIFI